jgi:hypothetical protein
MDIYQRAKEIKGKKDFELFLLEFRRSLDKDKDDWHNDRLDLFLDGLYGYNFDSNDEDPSWQKFAEMLLAARVYE